MKIPTSTVKCYKLYIDLISPILALLILDRCFWPVLVQIGLSNLLWTASFISTMSVQFGFTDGRNLDVLKNYSNQFQSLKIHSISKKIKVQKWISFLEEQVQILCLYKIKTCSLRLSSILELMSVSKSNFYVFGSKL